MSEEKKQYYCPRCEEHDNDPFECQCYGEYKRPPNPEVSAIERMWNLMYERQGGKRGA